ncbi:MAG: cardiolipin synthase [Bacteroidales bacterium]|nr:cardiolipin synthase [Bacteroidales bacterium]
MVANIILYILFALLFVGVAAVIIFDNGDSGTKLAWLLAITLLPIVGIVLYLMFGVNYRNHYFFQRRHKAAIDKFHSEYDSTIKKLLDSEPPTNLIREDFRPLAKLLGRVETGTNLSSGNSFEIITTGQRKQELLMKDIREAKESIHLEYFHFGNDRGGREVLELLEEKAREGVEIRFLNENIANFPIPSSYYNKMRKSGIEVERFTNSKQGILSLPMKLNYRNHRKVVVIDGKIGYTGGMNINNHYFFQWRDTHLRIEGNAVAALQATFLDSWMTSGGTLKQPLSYYFKVFNEPAEGQFKDKLIQIVPDESDSSWPLLQMGYEWVLQNAKDYVYMQTPYFVPPESFLIALKSAALRGVDVRIMFPEKVDTPFMGAANKAYYSECMEAGVKIYERGREFIHSKTVVCDDYLSQIGTANIDIRSFNLNHEVNAYIYDEQTALANKEIFFKDMEISKRLDPKGWMMRRKWYEMLFSRILRLFAGIL